MAPGNPGMSEREASMAIRLCKFWNPGIVGIDLTVVGPEAPLVGGVVDSSAPANLPIVGPGQPKERALEGSKIHSKRFMERRLGVPTAALRTVGPRADA